MPPLKMVCGLVGTVLLLAVVGIIALAFQGHTIPDVLQNVAVGALTALVSLLVPTRSQPTP